MPAQLSHGGGDEFDLMVSNFGDDCQYIGVMIGPYDASCVHVGHSYITIKSSAGAGFDHPIMLEVLNEPIGPAANVPLISYSHPILTVVSFPSHRPTVRFMNHGGWRWRW